MDFFNIAGYVFQGFATWKIFNAVDERDHFKAFLGLILFSLAVGLVLHP